MHFSNELPDMIIFDCGNTLAHESAPDFLHGWQAVFQYIDTNPDSVTPQQAKELADNLWQRFSGHRSLSALHQDAFEIHEWHQLRTVFDALALKTSLPLSEIEVILMDHSSPCKPVPYAAELLRTLELLGIRTGVISNIGWSGQALTHRLSKLFPTHHFEFIMASSEYGIRKPDPLLFQIAIQKARLPAWKIWFCGDNLQADIAGAHSAGIFPVWYQTTQDVSLPFPYLRVSNWREIINLLIAARQ